MQLGPCIASAEEGGSGLTLYHVDFIKPYTPSQSAPTTEVLAITLKEGKTKADLWKVLEAITAKIDEENPKYAPVTWGQTLEDEKKFYLTIGWDSSDVSFSLGCLMLMLLTWCRLAGASANYGRSFFLAIPYRLTSYSSAEDGSRQPKETGFIITST